MFDIIQPTDTHIAAPLKEETKDLQGGKIACLRL